MGKPFRRYHVPPAQGKGDDCRTQDYRRFREEYDRIFNPRPKERAPRKPSSPSSATTSSPSGPSAS